MSIVLSIFTHEKRSNVRHHLPPRAIDVRDNSRVGGRVRAVVRRRVADTTGNEYYLSPDSAAFAPCRLMPGLKAMKDARHRPEEAPSNGGRRLNASRIPLRVAVALIVLASALAGLLHWRRAPTTNASDPYADIPFRPQVTYNSSEVTISNTEGEPYLDTSLNIYVGATRYRVQVGTIRPGETVKRSLRGLTNERGESFEPGSPGTSELEVRARFGGYDVHKDFPPPP